MAVEELVAKQAYFQDQALLDITDDEQDFPDNGKNAFSRALDDTKAMPVPDFKRQGSSFLGPTPKERQAEFDTYTAKQRANARANERKFAQVPIKSAKRDKLERLSLESKGEALKKEKSNAKIEPNATRSNPGDENQTPFYIRTGAIPRELKSGRAVKPAAKIKLEPEHKQLLKGKIIYFYPNDDISMVRRTRIHKIIQLGAAWVNRWRDDVTHIMLDDASYSYTQLLKHLNKPGFTKRVALVKFDPYVPQCIQFGTLLDPTATRFVIKGAPHRTQSSEQIPSSQSTDPSQVSLKVKPSRAQKAALGSPRTESNPTEQSLRDSPGCPPPSSSEGGIVKDSFTAPAFVNGDQDGIKSSQFDEALSRAIEEAKAIAHLPLDDDESDSSPTAEVDSDDEAMDEATSGPLINIHNGFSLRVSKASALRDKRSNTNTFQCMNTSSGVLSASNPNARTIQILEEMSRHYDQMQDHWRTTAYRKAVTTLKKQTSKINTAQEAARLPFIGLRLADKIEEIVLTNRLRKLDNTKDDPLDSVLRLFLGIYGVGLVQANKWIQAGHRTLEDLKGKAKLTDSHKIGIEHYADFNSRIPRAEVEAHGAIVKAALKKLNPAFKATVMGSYRRGAKDSGDIDMIVTCPGATASTLRTVVFDTLVPQLFKADFLKASLATSRSNDTTGSKWHGASCLPSSTVWRRMDFLLVPDMEMGAALIYFTGNDIFNRSIRLLARKKGMRLNQRGLYKDVQRGRQGEKLNDGVLVEGRSEKNIFEILGVPWREPHERIC